MENVNDSKKRLKHPDRVTLSPESLSRLAGWISEGEGRLKGSRLTKSDLVNFLISSHAPALTERELEQLEKEHFDEVRFAAWALRQLKEARAIGEETTLAEIMAGARLPKQKGGTDGSTSSKPAK